MRIIKKKLIWRKEKWNTPGNSLWVRTPVPNFRVYLQKTMSALDALRNWGGKLEPAVLLIVHLYQLLQIDTWHGYNGASPHRDDARPRLRAWLQWSRMSRTQANRGCKCDGTAHRCIMKVPCLCQAEQKKRSRRYILHPTQSFILSINRSKSHNRAPHPFRTQNCEYFRPAPFSFLCHSTSARLWGKSSRRHHNTAGGQLRSRPNIFFAVIVIVVAFGRSLCFLSFQAVS